MKELSFKRGGKINYPVINNSENFELECEIFYAVSLQTIITDSAIYEKAESDPEKYLKEKMSDYMVTALHLTWEKAIPHRELPNLLKPMYENFHKVIGPELDGFGLQLKDFAILTLSINNENEKALAAHEIKKAYSNEEMDAILNNMFIDESYKPWPVTAENTDRPFVNPVFPGLFPSEKTASWNCKVCGKQNITSKFCPECGSPSDCPDR